jgi:hypothetical protein
MTRYSIKYKGKEVENSVIRGLIIIFGMFAMVCALILTVGVLCLLPILIPIDILLKMLGKKGFITYR